MQYGAVGVVAAGLLTLVVAVFWLFVKHALEQNKKLIERHDEIQEKHLAAVYEVEKAIRAMHSDLSRDLGQLFNEISAVTGGSRAHRITRPPRGT